MLGPDLFWWQGDAPQDWPPGPIVPTNEEYQGSYAIRITPSNGDSNITVTVFVGTPTPIGDQQNHSTPADTPPPCNPSSLPGSPQCIGPIGPVIVPPTYFWF